MSSGIAEGAIPYKKIGLGFDALPRSVVAVGHCEVYRLVLTGTMTASENGH